MSDEASERWKPRINNDNNNNNNNNNSNNSNNSNKNKNETPSQTRTPKNVVSPSVTSENKDEKKKKESKRAMKRRKIKTNGRKRQIKESTVVTGFFYWVTILERDQWTSGVTGLWLPSCFFYRFFYWTLQCFTAFYCCLLGLTGFDWV